MQIIWKNNLFIIALIITATMAMKPAESGSDIIRKMYGHNHNRWHKSVVFTQVTDRYRNDSLINTATWHESMVYPGRLLRIDIGPAENGNGILFRGDSTYQFRNHKIGRAAKGENELIFFSGSMYFSPVEEVLKHFTELGYDLNKAYSTTWKGKNVYVVGATHAEDPSNQLWIDKDMLVIVRFIKTENNRKQEGIFENHIKIKDAWFETKCSFYINDKLGQVETYKDIVADGPVDMKIFDPAGIEPPKQ